MTDDTEVDDKIVWPQLKATLHPDVKSECSVAYLGVRPWTTIRPLRVGVDDWDGQLCEGSQGNHQLECKGTVEAVQYTSAFGDPAFYCEKHAIEQNDWDIIHYHSTWVAKKLPKGWQEEVDAMMIKLNKKNKKKSEPEEIDPS